MKSRQTICFYGNSLVLAGLRARLQSSPWIEVRNLDEIDISAAHNCTVVYDMGSAETENLLALVEENPDVLLIGIDPESHAVLLGGQAAGNISLEQITKIIQIQENP